METGTNYRERMDELIFLVEMEADGGFVASAVGPFHLHSGGQRGRAARDGS